MESSSLMRQTLLEALLSVQLLRANVQQVKHQTHVHV